MQLAVLGGSSLFGGLSFGKAALFGASVAGSFLFKGKQKPQGKLNDVRVSSASYGRGIPGVWGTMRVTGNVFWTTDFREEKVYMTSKGKQKTGKKGSMKAKKGKAQPVFKYFVNFAVGLAEGVIDDVLRIWADNNLIYNKMNPSDDDLVTPGFSTRDPDDEGGGKGSMKSAQGKKGNDGESGRFQFRFYAGTEDQQPDPYMAKISAENYKKENFGDGTNYCPAYRDLCYLMFENFALEDFGNRIPTITAEVTAKSARKAAVTEFEVLPAPAGGWDIDYDGLMNFDPTRNMLIDFGRNKEQGQIAWWSRTFDISKKKELKRVGFGLDSYPYAKQMVLNTSTGEMVEITREQVAAMQPMGMSHKGDLVFSSSFNIASSPVVFFNSQTGKIISMWGSTSRVATPSVWNGIFAPWTAFPFPFTKIDSLDPTALIPKGGTAVRSILARNTWIFDDDYTLVTVVEHVGNRRENIIPGAPGTTNAMMTSTTNYGGNDTYLFYKTSVDAPIGGIDPISGAPIPNKEQLFSKWPLQPLGIGTSGFAYLHHMSYVVGAEALCLVCSTIGTGAHAVKIDPITGDHLWDYTIPGTSGTSGKDLQTPYNTLFITPNYSNTNVVSWIQGNQHVRVDFRDEKVEVFRFADSYIPAIHRGMYYWSEKDAVIYTYRNPAGQRAPVIIYLDRKIQKGALLTDICRDVAVLAGVPESRIDTTGLVQTDEVIGYMYEQPTGARDILEELADLFMFDAIESNGILYFKSRGKESIRTIPQADLGIVSSDFGGQNEYYADVRINEAELPRRGSITYFNPKEDYEQATQIFNRPSDPIPVMATNEALEITANMALNATVARSLLSRIIFAAWSERTQRTIVLPRDHLDLDPTDVITVTLDNGEDFQGRITDMSIGNNFELEVQMVSQTPAAYTYRIPADTTRGPVQQPPGGPAVADPMVFNIPYLDDADVDDGAQMSYYWAAAAISAGFKYGVLQSKLQDTELAVEGSTAKDALWGFTNALVPPPRAWNTPDDSTIINLIPGFDFNENNVVYEWENVPDNEWPSTKNMILIGDEIILFKNAEVLEDGTINISNLIRGYRGSNDAGYRHEITSYDSQYWALVIGNEIRTAQEPISNIGKEITFNVHTGNYLAALTRTRKEKLDGATRRPLPVGGIKRSNTGGNAKVDWKRATRYNGELVSGTGTVPLNEESQKFTIFLLKAPYDPKTWDPTNAGLYHLRVDDLTNPTYTFTSGVLSPFGYTPTSMLPIVIYQNSAQVGLGFPHGINLQYSMFGDY